ncbi:MAG: hypothetical protein ACFE95_14715 [Candidatus Hodarchaeota archaeon]
MGKTIEKSRFDRKNDDWLKRKYDIGDYSDDHYRNLKRQHQFFTIQYMLQILLFLGTIIFPWYRFIKTYMGDSTIIDAGVWQLNDWTIHFLLLGTGYSLLVFIIALRNPVFERSKRRLFNLAFIVILAPVISTFMYPEFAPGLGGHFQESTNFYWISLVGYSIYPHIGYLFLVLLGIVVLIGVILSLIWQA